MFSFSWRVLNVSSQKGLVYLASTTLAFRPLLVRVLLCAMYVCEILVAPVITVNMSLPVGAFLSVVDACEAHIRSP